MHTNAGDGEGGEDEWDEDEWDEDEWEGDAGVAVPSGMDTSMQTEMNEIRGSGRLSQSDVWKKILYMTNSVVISGKQGHGHGLTCIGDGFVEGVMYQKQLQLLNAPSSFCVMEDPGVYVMQLSDGRHYVNAVLVCPKSDESPCPEGSELSVWKFKLATEMCHRMRGWSFGSGAAEFYINHPVMTFELYMHRFDWVLAVSAAWLGARKTFMLTLVFDTECAAFLSCLSIASIWKTPRTRTTFWAVHASCCRRSTLRLVVCREVSGSTTCRSTSGFPKSTEAVCVHADIKW